MNHLVDSSFEGVNRRFVSSFENEDDRKSYLNYFLPKVEIKDYNVMIDGNVMIDDLFFWSANK